MNLFNVAEYKVVCLREGPRNTLDAATPESVYDIWRSSVVPADWYRPEQECLVAFMLNTRRRCTGVHLISMGTLNTILVPNGAVFRAAIVASCVAIVLAHNHPSGDPSPSEADIVATRRLIKCGQLLEVEVVDHLIIGDCADGRSKPYCSLRELGYFYS